MVEYLYSDYQLYGLPYLTGKTCYRLALRPPVGPMRIPELILRSRLLEFLANFKSELQCFCLNSLGTKRCFQIVFFVSQR